MQFFEGTDRSGIIVGTAVDIRNVAAIDQVRLVGLLDRSFVYDIIYDTFTISTSTCVNLVW